MTFLSKLVSLKRIPHARTDEKATATPPASSGYDGTARGDKRKAQNRPTVKGIWAKTVKPAFQAVVNIISNSGCACVMSLEVVGSEMSFAQQASYLATSSHNSRGPQAAVEPTELSNEDYGTASNEPEAWRIPAYRPRGMTSKHQAAAKRMKAPAKLADKGLKIVPELVCRSTCLTSVDSLDSYPAWPKCLPVLIPNKASRPAVAKDTAAHPIRVAPPTPPQNTPTLQAAGAPEKEVTTTTAIDAPVTKRRILPALCIPESCAADTLRRFGNGQPSSSGAHPVPPETPQAVESPEPSPHKPYGKNKLRASNVQGRFWCAVFYHAEHRQWLAMVPDHAAATLAASDNRQVAISMAEQLLATQVMYDRFKGVVALPYNREKALAQCRKTMQVLFESGDLPLSTLWETPSWVRFELPRPTRTSDTELLSEYELAAAASLL